MGEKKGNWCDSHSFDLIEKELMPRIGCLKILV